MVSTVKAHGQDVSAISAGGGLSVPYKTSDPSVDTQNYFELWNRARREIESIVGHAVQLEIEPGRFLVAQAGVLISELRAHKPMGRNQFMLVDAGFNDLMRPALYGAYHHVSVLDPSGVPRGGALRDTIVAGPLCESGDVFTQNASGEVETRPLPNGQVGDWVVFHDAGAYGASMSSNYNSRPLLPEVMVDGDEVRLVRRRQTVADLMDLEQL
jgi:diaminopimelate decarboxylase